MKKELEEEFEEDEEENEEGAEESELEEELEKPDEPTLDLNFNNLDFSQFTPFVDADSSSPVLESIESRIDRPGFVQTGFGASQSELGLGESGKDTYIPSQGGDDGPKYLQPGGTETNIKRVDVQSIGRDIGGFNIPQPGNFFISSESDFQSTNVEQGGMQPGRVDMQKIGRQNPLERKEVKYEEHKKYEFDTSK